MGYCCPYAFLRVNKRTGAIAILFGMTDRAIRYWKRKFRKGELKCEESKACLLPQIIKLGK